MSNSFDAPTSPKQVPVGQIPGQYDGKTDSDRHPVPGELPVPGTSNFPVGTGDSLALQAFKAIEDNRPLSQDFATKALDVAKKIDSNHDGFLQPFEIDFGLLGIGLNQSEKDTLNAIQKNADKLKDFSNDEYFWETTVTTNDLHKYAEIEKSYKADPNPDKDKDAAFENYVDVSKDLLRTDLSNAVDDLVTFVNVEGKPLASDALNEEIEKLNIDPKAKEIAKEMQASILNGDLSTFQKQVPEWSKDPAMLKTAADALNGVMTPQDKCIRVSVTDDGKLALSRNDYVRDRRNLLDANQRFDLGMGLAMVFDADGSPHIRGVRPEHYFGQSRDEQLPLEFYPGEITQYNKATLFDRFSTAMTSDNDLQFVKRYSDLIYELDKTYW